MKFKNDEIIFLLGAGASYEAGIPISTEMVKKVEEKVVKDESWSQYKNIYNFLKSAILYADGIRGNFESNKTFNIERLVNVLYELEKKEEHPIYPFIGQWNIKFAELIDNDFKKISDFRSLILKQLLKWVTPDHIKEASSYFENFKTFKKEYNFSLRIFTLNYDLCIEESLSELNVNRGFDQKEKIWNYRLYDTSPESEESYEVYLYKLHGSIDWERIKKTGEVTYREPLRIDEPDLIFGTNYKLQYVDPYLFQYYELRKYSFSAKLIIVIGYSFADEHINGILGQSLRKDSAMKILAVSPDEEKERLCEILNLKKNTSQIEVERMGAKEFLSSKLNLKFLEELFSSSNDDELAF